MSNPRLPLRFVALLGALVLFGLSCGSSSPVAATVNGVDVSVSSIEDEAEAILNNTDYTALIEQNGITVKGQGAGTLDAAFMAQILTRRIAFELVAEELKVRSVEVATADLDEARERVTQQVGGDEIFTAFPVAYQDILVRRTAEVAVLQRALADLPEGDGAARALYDADPSQFAEVCAHHILVESEEEANEVISRLAGGAVFEDIARTESVDTGSGANGGDLGCAPRGVYVPEFEEGLFSAPEGEIVGPVQTQFGFHVIRADEHRQPTFEESADKVAERLSSAGQEAFGTWLQEALDSATVKVNPRFGTWSSGMQPQVEPPLAPSRPVDPDAIPDPILPPGP